MSGKNTAAFGIYRDYDLVQDAIEALKSAGFRSTDISVLAPENQGTKDLAHERHSKAPEGAVAGAGSGAVLGGALGWLAGAGLLALPGMGLLVAAGPILGLLSGIGVGGTVGGITGALMGMGIPEYEAKRYIGRVRNGGILLSVHCDNGEWTKRAREVLRRSGATDISVTNEAKSDYLESDKPLPRTRSGSVA